MSFYGWHYGSTMNEEESKLKDKIVLQAVKSVKKDKKIDQVSLLAIANELEVDFSEVTQYYTSIEDIFLHQQKRQWKQTYKKLDKDSSYTLMHQSILSSKKNLCTYDEGINVVKLIKKIKKN